MPQKNRKLAVKMILVCTCQIIYNSKNNYKIRNIIKTLANLVNYTLFYL